jgi:hypothetical protein
MDLKAHGLERPLVGILGMDCLRHYCIQLDFADNKMRFLDPDALKVEDLGQTFPLTQFRGCFMTHDNLVGATGAKMLVDTGCNFDGVLTPKLFQRWTNQISTALFPDEARFPNAVFGGVAYTNLYLNGDGGENLLGLAFLARNLVTLNFPKRTMYLQRRSTGSLAEGNGFFDDFYRQQGIGRAPSKR